ncbi:hypothetical protein Tco_0641966 [Tanacetum coccineum]
MTLLRGLYSQICSSEWSSNVLLSTVISVSWTLRSPLCESRDKGDVPASRLQSILTVVDVKFIKIPSAYILAQVACSFMLCDLDFEPLSLSLSSMPSCDLVSFTNILILCLILKASNQSLRKSLSLNLELS